jgi:hypothetical protein
LDVEEKLGDKFYRELILMVTIKNMKKIRITESELVSLIRRVINEQKCEKGFGCKGKGDITGSNVSKKDGISGGDGGGGADLIIDPSQLEPEWIGITNPERTSALKSTEAQKQLAEFQAKHPQEPKTFFYALYRDTDRFNTINKDVDINPIDKTKKTNRYDQYFGPDGKTLLKPKNDGSYKFLGWIRGLCNIFNGKDSSPWIIYYRMNFGKRTDLTAEELYNHFKTIDNMKKIVESGYNKNEIINNNKIDCRL